MPVLPAPMQAGAQKAAEEGSQFSALEPGVYTARLSKVDATNSKSSSNPMWALEFDEVHDLDGHKKPGRQFTNLVLIDSVQWKVGQFFGAYGVPTSTNTDNLIGHRIRLNIGKRVIQQGARAGQEGNEITGFVPLAENDDGYLQNQQLRSKLGVAPAAAAPQQAAPPAATAAQAQPPAAAAQPAATPAAAPAGDQWGPAGGGADDGGVEF